MDLLKFTDKLIETKYPDLKENFYGLSAVLGQLIFSVRVNKGLTQKQLANLADVSPKTVHRVEGGSGGITDNTYEKILKVLDLDLMDLSAAFKKRAEKKLVKH